MRGGVALLIVMSVLVGACEPGLVPPPTQTPVATSSGCEHGEPSAPTEPGGPTPGCTMTPGPPTQTTAPPTGTPPTGTATPTTPATPSPTPTATPSPTPPPGLLVERTVPYAAEECGERVTECQQFVDVYAPAAGAEAGPYPVAVMIHGRPRRPRDMDELAIAVASRGAVVFNADYRGVRPVVQEGWPEAPEDVACAIRFARAHAAEYGGDASTLVLVGHSYGGYLGPLIALAGDEFSGDCLVGPEVSALPTGFVGIAGNYVVEGEPVWDVWYGGSEDERPAAWRQGNYRTHLAGNPALVVRLIHERGDPIIPPRQPRRLQRDLRDAGYDTRLRLIDGEEHFALLDTDGNGALVVPLVLELLGIE